jgi:hypothetical protein
MLGLRYNLKDHTRIAYEKRRNFRMIDVAENVM